MRKGGTLHESPLEVKSRRCTMGPLVENDRKVERDFFCDLFEGSESSQYLREEINRDIGSSGERNRSKHIELRQSVSKTIEFVAREGEGPVDSEFNSMKEVARAICVKNGEPSSKL